MTRVLLFPLLTAVQLLQVQARELRLDMKLITLLLQSKAIFEAFQNTTNIEPESTANYAILYMYFPQGDSTTKVRSTIPIPLTAIVLGSLLPSLSAQQGSRVRGNLGIG